MAVTMAVAGTASAATIDQFRMGAKTTVYGGERKATLQQADKELKQPSAYLVQLNAQPTSFVQYLESNATKRDTVLANQVGRMFRPTLQVGK